MIANLFLKTLIIEQKMVTVALAAVYTVLGITDASSSALIGGGFTLVAVVVSHFLTRRQLVEIHSVVNSRLTAALKEIENLQANVRDLRGVQGLQGATGPVGETGATGATGVQGATGAAA